MRMLIAIALGCALVIGAGQASSSGAADPPASELPTPAAEDTSDGATDGATDGMLGNESAYECRYSPYCHKASQCIDYCAGGIAVCQFGCCACAS
jgi:hypothetical protein